MLLSISYAVSGLSLLLFAMWNLTKSLDREVVRRLGLGFQKVTKSAWRSVLSGILTTLIVQASSVTIISTMGFVGRGLISLDKAILVVLGAGIGSSVKGWYASGFVLSLGPVLLLIGVFALLLSRNSRQKRIFEVVVALGMTFLGLELIARGLAPMAQTHFVQQFLDISLEDGFFSVFKMVLVGFFFSVLLQSSSSVLILVIGFSAQGLISVPAAMGILLGANLGTTTTPLLASLGQKSADARRLAYAYCLMKLGSTALVLIYFRTHAALLEDLSWIFGFEQRPELSMMLFYTWFNVMNAISWWILLPLLVRVLIGLVPGKEVIFGTTPFTLGIQKLLSSLPGRALSEGIHQLQQVIRDLHWVSDGIFYLVDRRENPEQDQELMQQSLRRCEAAVDVLDAVRDVAWRYLQTSENPNDSKEKILGIIFLAADLKNIECILSACVKELSGDSFDTNSPSASTLNYFHQIRVQLNQSWEKIYALEAICLKESHSMDLNWLQVSTRLTAVNRLLERNYGKSDLKSVYSEPVDLGLTTNLAGSVQASIREVNV